MEVELVRWPVDEGRRRRLSDGGRPRLLLVTDDVAPPISTDPLEDWIRMPAEDRDLEARVEAIQRSLTDRPALDEDGVLRVGSRWVALAPTEARLAALLLERWGKVVLRDELIVAGWPGLDPKRNLLDVHVLRLRRRLEPLGLVIRTVRKRGYVLDLASSDGDRSSSESRKQAVADP